MNEYLKEAIADFGIDIALECCADLIRDGYLDATHTPYDCKNLIRLLENNKTKVQLFQRQYLIPEEL
jgi:hypothetical protein